MCWCEFQNCQVFVRRQTQHSHGIEKPTTALRLFVSAKVQQDLPSGHMASHDFTGQPDTAKNKMLEWAAEFYMQTTQ